MSLERQNLEANINKLKGLEAYKDRPLGQRVLQVLTNLKGKVDSMPDQYAKKKEAMYAQMRNMTSMMLQKYAPQDIQAYEGGLRRSLDDFSRYLQQSAESKVSVERQMTPNPELSVAQNDINAFSGLAQQFEAKRASFENHELTVGEQEYATMKNEYTRIVGLAGKADREHKGELSDAFLASADRQITNYVNNYYRDLPKVADFARLRLGYLITQKAQTYFNVIKANQTNPALKQEIATYKAIYEKYKTRSIDNDQALATLLRNGKIPMGVSTFIPPDPVQDLGIDISGLRFKNGYMEGVQSGFNYIISAITLIPQLSYNLGYTDNAKEAVQKTIQENTTLKSLADTYHLTQEVGDTLGSIWAINTGDPAQLGEFMREFQQKPTVQTIDLLLNLKPSDVERLLNKITPEQWGQMGGQMTVALTASILSGLVSSKAMQSAPEWVQALFKERHTALETNIRQYLKAKFDLHFGKVGFRYQERAPLVDTRQSPYHSENPSYHEPLAPSPEYHGRANIDLPEPVEKFPRLPAQLQPRAEIAVSERNALLTWYQKNAGNDPALRSISASLQKYAEAPDSQTSLENLEGLITDARRFKQNIEAEVAEKARLTREAAVRKQAQEKFVESIGKEEIAYCQENMKPFLAVYDIGKPENRPLATRLYLRAATETQTMEKAVANIKEFVENPHAKTQDQIRAYIRNFNALHREAKPMVEEVKSIYDAVMNDGLPRFQSTIKNAIDGAPYTRQKPLKELKDDLENRMYEEIERMEDSLSDHYPAASLRPKTNESTANWYKRLRQLSRDQEALEAAKPHERAAVPIVDLPTNPVQQEIQPPTRVLPGEKLQVREVTLLGPKEKEHIRLAFEGLRQKVVTLRVEGREVQLPLRNVVGHEIDGVLEEIDMPRFEEFLRAQYESSIDAFTKKYTEDLPNYLRYYLEEIIKTKPEFAYDIEDGKYTIVNEVLKKFDASSMSVLMDSKGQSLRVYYRANFKEPHKAPDFLGQGGFGTVYRARSYSETGSREIAIKTVTSNNDHTLYTQQIAKQEIATLQEFSHNPEAHKYLVSYEGSSGKGEIALEKLGKSLRGISKTQGEIEQMPLYQCDMLVTELNEKTLESYFQRIEDAVRFMHKNGYAHCDIKPGNIAFSPEDNLPRLMDVGGAVKKEALGTAAGSGAYTRGFGFQDAIDDANVAKDITILQDMDWYAVGKTFRSIVDTGIMTQMRTGAPHYSEEFLARINDKCRQWMTKMQGYEESIYKTYEELDYSPRKPIRYYGEDSDEDS